MARLSEDSGNQVAERSNRCRHRYPNHPCNNDASCYPHRTTKTRRAAPTPTRADNGDGPGTHAEIYVLTEDRNPVLKGTSKTGVIAQKVDYVTRDVVHKGDYCDGGPLSAPYFTMYRNVYGRSKRDHKQFNALACAAIDLSSNRLFRIDPPVDLRPRS
jgi:hypothetical protein